MTAGLPNFQYTTPAITAGNLTLDAEALNCFVRRAESLYGTGIDYGMSGQDWKASEEAVPGTKMDCTGFVWWSTYRNRQAGGLWPPNANWLEISQPVAGCAVRRGALPGQEMGHAGMVISVKDGNFQTLDSSSTNPKPRSGAIRYTQDGAGFWLSKPDCRFVVSNQAVLAVNGVPYKRPLNLLLAAAKRPVATAFAGVAVLLVTAGTLFGWWEIKGKNKEVA